MAASRTSKAWRTWKRSVPATTIRIAGHLAKDRLVRPRAVTLEDVPTSVASITPAWLTAALCPPESGANVLDFSVVGSSSGTHQRHRLALTYDEAGREAGLPSAVFVKSLPTLVTRMMGGYNGTARVEGRFYLDLRPQLDIEAPFGYHSAFDRRSLAGVNLIEDIVATRQATFCDHRTVVSREMAEQMVDLLADLHAHRYGDAAFPDEIPWLGDYPTWFRVGSLKMRTEHYTAKALDEAADVIPAEVLDRRDEVWPATVAATEIHRRGPGSFLHSDVHIGNWYRTGAGDMGLCDWQCPSWGHFSRDLSYALSASLRPDDRRAWERDLVDRYVERLAARTGTEVSATETWDLYRQQMLHALWMWTITLCHSPFLPSMQSEATSMEMIARISTAMADLDSLDATA